MGVGGRLFRLTVMGLALLGSASGWARGADVAVRDLASELQGAQGKLAAGDYAQAYEAYLAHSEDNPLAQFSVGLFFQYGWGRPVDLAQACRWQEKAAQGNIPAAQAALAECLRHGVHRSVDLIGAAHWYEQAALSGMLTANCSLAELFMAGEGVPKNPNKAIQLCRAVAEKGVPSAQLQLARFHLEGDATVRDPVAALQWMQSAAQSKLPEAQYRLGLMLRNGVGKPANMAAARWWLESAGEQGWAPAYLPTAELYFSAPVDAESGVLSPTDLAKAYLWSAAATQVLNNEPEANSARALLAKVLALMPSTWKPELDRQIAEHLVRLNAEKPSGAP